MPLSQLMLRFPRRLPDLPRKQISPEVLASLSYTPEVPSQYIRDQMECLGPTYVFNVFTIRYIP